MRQASPCCINDREETDQFCIDIIKMDLFFFVPDFLILVHAISNGKYATIINIKTRNIIL